MKDLWKLKQRWYFFDEDENKELIQILKNHLHGEYIKIFDIEVVNDYFKFNTLWRFDESFGNSIKKFDIYQNLTRNTKNRDKVLFDDVYDFLIQREIRIERNLKLRELGIIN